MPKDIQSDAGPPAPDSSDQDRIAELESRLEELQGKYGERLIADALHAAYSKQGGRASAASTAVLAMRAAAGNSLAIDPKGNISLRRQDGSQLTDADGVRHDLLTWVRDWLAANPIFLGTGAHAGSGASPSTSASDLSAEEILRRIRKAKTLTELTKIADSLGLR